MAYHDLGEAPAADPAIRGLLDDIAHRKEFTAFRGWAPRPSAEVLGSLQIPAYYLSAGRGGVPLLPGLQLHGAQRFVENFGGPDTPYGRLILNWQTGTGKTIAIIAIALRHVAEYRERAGTPPADRPTVFIVGFTRKIIQKEMLSHPEFGFASRAEIAETERLRRLGDQAGPQSLEARQYGAHLGGLRRRITDRARGGYFQFMGYREFAGRLVRVTRKGAAAGLTLQKVFGQPEAGDAGGAGETPGGEAVARIARAVAAEELEVDEDILATLRRGFLAADEIHNTYNIQAKNNYGAAIQYALDRLEAEGPGVAPRAVFATATMMTGSAPEIVDLLNLAIPRRALPGGRRLERGDFFSKSGELAAAAPGARQGRGARWALRPGALERLGRLSAGRVTFLLDTDEASYPRRIFEGEPLRDGRTGAAIAYLLFTPCPMSPFHARTLAHFAAARPADVPDPAGEGAPDAGRTFIPANAYALYDMAYPNPAFPPGAAAEAGGASHGLYLSGETPRLLLAAPADWRRAAGVEAEPRSGGAGAAAEIRIRGGFLALEPGADAPPGLEAYSAKFARVVRDLLAIVRAGPGKAMVYHQRVRGAGVLQLLEILQANGFASETSIAGPGTLCAVCGVVKKAHGAAAAAAAAALRNPHEGLNSSRAAAHKGHAYTPARVLVVHSELEPAGIERVLAKANDLSNLEGYEYRVLLGSKIMQEGRNLMAFREQLILSLPGDIPTLIQLLGRVSRNGSHSPLPPGQRDVRVRIYVTTGGAGAEAPEPLRYAEKMQEYFPIQKINREFRRRAVDGPLRFGEMSASGAVGPEPSLMALPYEPLAPPPGPFADAGAGAQATFAAYGHGDREVATIVAVIRALFAVRPVWTYADLWAAVRTPGAVAGLAADPASFGEESYALAVSRLGGHNPGLRVDPPEAAGALPLAAVPADFQIVRAGRFYVLAPPPHPGLGGAAGGGPVVDIESYLRGDLPPARVRVRVSEYARAARSAHNFQARLRRFEEDYAPGGAPIEDALVAYPPKFHEELLRRLVEAEGPPPPRTAALGRATELYLRFRLLVPAAELRAHPEGARLGFAALDARPGGRALVGYVAARTVRLYVPPSGRRRAEWLDIPREALAIGPRFVENDVVVGYTGEEGQFKVRPPIQALAAEDVPDIRSLARGAVCRTRTRAEQESLARRLGAASRPEARAATRGQLCALIQARLLDNEEAARNGGAEGMVAGLRWFYLLGERMPAVAAGRT